jgi:hypothetical protein
MLLESTPHNTAGAPLPVESIHDPTWDQIEQSVHQLDQHRHPLIRLRSGKAGTVTLEIIGGNGIYALREPDGDWVYYDSTQGDEEIVVQTSGQGYRCPAYYVCTDLKRVLEIARGFCETGVVGRLPTSAGKRQRRESESVQDQEDEEKRSRRSSRRRERKQPATSWGRRLLILSIPLLALGAAAVALVIFWPSLRTRLSPPPTPPTITVDRWYTARSLPGGFGSGFKLHDGAQNAGMSLLVAEFHFPPGLIGTTREGDRWQATFDTADFHLLTADGTEFDLVSWDYNPLTPEMEGRVSEEWIREPPVLSMASPGPLPEYLRWQLAFVVPTKNIEAGGLVLRHKGGTSAELAKATSVRSK